MCILYNIWFSYVEKAVIVLTTVQCVKLTDMSVTKKLMQLNNN